MKAIYRKGREGAQRAVETFRATLREIFDEAGYERFLRRNRLAACRDSYDEFLRESAARRERRPRCC